MINKILHTHSAGGIILNDRGEVVVVSQRGTSWSLPKGHIEEGEDAVTAAKREILEETGIQDLIFVKELGKYERYRIGIDSLDDKSEIKTITMFLFKSSSKSIDLKPSDKDNPEARWIKKENVADLLTHPKDKEFFMSVIPILD